MESPPPHQPAIIYNNLLILFMFSFPLVAPNPRLDSARGEIKKSQKSGIFTEIKKPLKNGGLFSAFVYVYFTPESGTLSTAFLPFFIDRLDSAGIGPQTRIDGYVQGGIKVMKISKQFLLAGAVLCAISAAPAHAVTKCVALNSSTTCTSDDTQYQGHTDWAATCTTNGVSTPISGIGICSSTRGSSTGQTATELDTSSTIDNNKYCWCKMTSPAVSRWVFRLPFTSAGFCARLCALNCAISVRDFAAFRSALFGNLSD